MPLKLYAQWSGAPTTSLFFPLTAEAGNVTLFGVTLPRSAGGMREPGLSQLFIVIGLITVARLRPRRSRVVAGGLVAGLVVSGSTAGLVSLTVAVLVASLVGSRSASPVRLYLNRLFGVASAALGAWALMALPSIGLLDKQTESGSVDARRSAFSAGLDSIFNHPFGQGLGASAGDLSINLIGMAAQFGIPGLVLVAGTYLALGLGRRSATRYCLSICMVVLVTGLSSQPLFNMPSLYLAMLIAVGAAEPVPETWEPPGGARHRHPRLRGVTASWRARAQGREMARLRALRGLGHASQR
jgi:hypothetical protein